MQRHPVLGILFVFFLLVPTWSVVTVQAQGGNITTFSDGTSQHTVTVSAGMHTPIGIELQRNTTVTSSTFFISPDQSSSSAGIVELDVNQDGSPSGRLTKPVTAIWAIKRCLHQAISPIQSLSILFLQLFDTVFSIDLPSRRSHFFRG